MSLKDAGWARYAPETTPDNLTGRVALVHRDRFVVWTDHGEVTATTSGHLRYSEEAQPCIGDWVTLREGSVISAVLPRRTKLSRKEPGRRTSEQVLAANIDVLFVVNGLDGDYNPRRLSALREWGLDAIRSQIRPEETAALIGSSGVGKSAIVNALLGEMRQRTSEVRESDSRGKHTTTHRELIRMPGDWLLMDLPGVRELQLWGDGLDEGLGDAFAEIAELAEGCRFRDCSHEGEPGCAVREGELDPLRLESYFKLKKEVRFLERQADARLAKETKQKWKAIEKDARRHPKRW